MKGIKNLWNRNNKVTTILSIAFPMIVQGLVFQVQSLTDKAFLGNIDAIYISALGAAQFPLATTLDSLVAISTGIILLVSQLYGAREPRRIKEVVKSGMFYNSLIAAMFFILWFGFPRHIFQLLSVDDAILPISISYVKICSFYFLFLGIDATLQAMLQGIGYTKIIMYAGIVKVVLNVIISWVLIFGLFGFPELMVDGAAIGTLVANLTSAMLVILYCFIRKKQEFHLHKENRLWFAFRPFQKMIALGLPTGLEFLCWNLSNLILIKLLNSFSYQAMAIYTLTFGIDVVFYALFNGTSKANMILMGQRIGAGSKEDANLYFRTCLRLNVKIVGVATLMLALFPSQILSLFTKESDTILRTEPFLIFTAFIMIPKSLNVVIGSAIRAYSDTKWMLFSQLIGSVFVITCSYSLVTLMQLNVEAIYITLILDETIRAGINYRRFVVRYQRVSVS